MVDAGSMLVRLALVAVAASVAATAALGQALYKYRGADGEWVFTDRQPAEVGEIEVRELSRGEPDPRLSVYYRVGDADIRLYGRNEYHAPVEVAVVVEDARDVVLPGPEQDLRFVVPARQEMYLMSFDVADGASEPYVAYRYRYLIGDPSARHHPEKPYRAPFAVARTHAVSQAYPYTMTHRTRDAAYAVDISMPIGTDIYAAREGIVLDVASSNYRGGIDAGGEGAEANIVRILHDDGTYAIYAHLNWNGIRVKPGDVVARGEYIADSGNTGFSSGPHLHFVVLRNAGMRLESVPIEFEGPNGIPVTPSLGTELVAY